MTSTVALPLPIEEATPGRLVVAGLDFEVHLSGTRRSIGITVDRDGSLIVTGPEDCGNDELARFAHDKRMWVYKKLAEKDLLLSRRPRKEFVSGAGFRYLGRSYRLVLTDGDAGSIKLERGRLMMSRDVASSGTGASAMIDWYRARGSRWFPRRVKPWAQRMGVRPAAIDVRDLGYRWGSRGKNDHVNFHWATMQLQPALVDYIIVHELAHIGEAHHTPEFWAAVQRGLPTYLRAKDDLAHIGSNLWLGESVDARGNEGEA